MWLGELGAYHYKARVYLPHLGIFAQTDPIGYKSSANLYAYTINDPANLTDALGLDVTCTGSRIPQESCGNTPGLSCMGECSNFLSSDQRAQLGLEDRFGGVRPAPQSGAVSSFDLAAIAACAENASACFAGDALAAPNSRNSIGVLSPLSPQEQRVVNALLSSPVTQFRIDFAWSQTMETSNEYAFFVFLNGVNGNTYNFTLSRVYGGVSPTNPGRLFALHANLYGDFFASVHTQPFTGPLSLFPSRQDVVFGRAHNSIVIIRTFIGYVVGR
jgi:hypothetical protein